MIYRKPHKHAALIKAWANGAEIQARLPAAGDWVDTPQPAWYDTMEYRIKPVPPKWQKEKDAHYAGKVVQWRNARNPTGPWHDMVPKSSGYGFCDPYEYRIKPEKVVQDVCVRWVNSPDTRITTVEIGLAFIPDKQTMYIMLGLKTTDGLVNSETGQRVQKIVNERLDEYLKEFEKKK